MIDIPDSNDTSLAMIQSASQHLRTADQIKVTNAAESIGAQHLRSSITFEIKRLNEKRLSITRNMDQAKKDVINMFAKPILMLEAAQESIDAAVIAYTLEQEAITKASQNYAQAKADHERAKLLGLAAKARDAGQELSADLYHERAKNVVTEVVQSGVAKAEGVSMREVWKWRLRDASKINPAFMCPDDAKIQQIVKTLKGDAEGVVGEGIEVYSEKILTSRHTSTSL